ncbi:hypothetical protein EVAR_65406_1 [Eumeta japonica]|uniref:Uncharacterized protein n=1 Tax=Eumeta variegata TaxID=151549 RepID=A0A4C1ZU33_EUMVA|nr:hypothetical protein EVAR_65406_1 [Eumeta japonica]
MSLGGTKESGAGDILPVHQIYHQQANTESAAEERAINSGTLSAPRAGAGRSPSSESMQIKRGAERATSVDVPI